MHTINLDDVKYTEIPLLAKTMQVKLLLYQLKIQTHFIYRCGIFSLAIIHSITLVPVKYDYHGRMLAFLEMCHQIQFHSTYLSKLSGDMPPDSPSMLFTHTM